MSGTPHSMGMGTFSFVFSGGLKKQEKIPFFKQGKVLLWGPSGFSNFLNLLVSGFQIWKQDLLLYKK